MLGFDLVLHARKRIHGDFFVPRENPYPGISLKPMLDIEKLAFQIFDKLEMYFRVVLIVLHFRENHLQAPFIRS
jgi:hypothetical protein